jgi:carbon storage regulator
MLILSRRESERICLGDDIVLTIVRVNGDKVRIGIEAPANVKILRNELENHRTLPAGDPPQGNPAPRKSA